MRTVLITGATGNMGEPVARAFLDNGDLVVLSGRNRERLNELQATLRPFERVEINLSDPGHAGGAEELVNDVISRRGPIDVFVHLIGIFAMTKITEADDLDWVSIMSTNAFSAAYLLKDILPHMTEQGYGKVVFVSSMAAHYPGSGLGPYAASKVALEAIARTAAQEAKDGGVNVNVVSITTLDSPNSRRSMPKTDPTHFIPGGDIAGTVLYLCSDAARSINGAVIPLMGKGSVNVKL